MFVLIVLVLVVLLFVRIARGDTGRAFLAVRANERAAASVGIDVRRTKLIGFGLSAFIAGIAGCLIGYSQGQLSADSFSVVVGLSVLAVAYLGGITSFGGALVAGILGPLGLVYTVAARGVRHGERLPPDHRHRPDPHRDPQPVGHRRGDPPPGRVGEEQARRPRPEEGRATDRALGPHRRPPPREPRMTTGV